jgi:hypothetical protein
LLGNPPRGDVRRTARLAHQDALLAREPATLGFRGLDPDGFDGVDRVDVEDVAHEPGPHPFELVRARLAGREHGVRLGLDRDDVHLGVLLAESAPDPGERPAGPDRGDERIDGPIADLIENLYGGRLVVCADVRRVLELAELDHSLVFEFVGTFLRALDLAVDEFEVCTVRRHDLPPFCRFRGGHDDREVVPLRRRDHRETDPGVAARRLDKAIAWLQHALALGGLDHRRRGAVLRRPAGVLRFDLRSHGRAFGRTDLDEGRTDGVEDAVVHCLRVRNQALNR